MHLPISRNAQQILRGRIEHILNPAQLEAVRVTDRQANQVVVKKPARLEVQFVSGGEDFQVTELIGGLFGVHTDQFDDQARILLMLRTDNQRWCMPGGMQDVGESSEECAVREAREETGLVVRTVDLVGVFTRLPRAEYTPFTLVVVVYLCEIVGGELRSSHEDLGLKYWNLEDVPVWHGDKETQARAAHQKWLTHLG